MPTTITKTCTATILRDHRRCASKSICRRVCRGDGIMRRGSKGKRRVSGGGWRRDGAGKCEPETGSMPQGALDSYLSLLPAHQLLANIETQAKTRLPPFLNGSLTSLVKSLPDGLLLLSR